MPINHPKIKNCGKVGHIAIASTFKVYIFSLKILTTMPQLFVTANETGISPAV